MPNDPHHADPDDAVPSRVRRSETAAPPPSPSSGEATRAPSRQPPASSQPPRPSAPAIARPSRPPAVVSTRPPAPRGAPSDHALHLPRASPDPPTFRRLLLRTIVVPVVLVAALAAGLFWQIRQLVQASRWVDRTDRAIALGNHTQMLSLDAETGLRGYLVTHDPVYLAPYVRATAALNPALDELGALVADNPAQATRLRELRESCGAWVRYAEQLLQGAARPGELPNDVHLVGKALMDGVRARFGEFLAEESRERDVRADRSRTAATTTMVLSLGVMVVLAVAFAVFARRQLGVLAATYGRALEEERAARRDVEAVARLKDEFLGTVSHELRTPLTAILGWVQMLRAGVIPEDQRLRAFESIQRNAQAQAQLVEDLLDVSRVTSGRLRLHVAPVDSAQVVTAALDAVRPSAEAKGLALAITLDPNAGAVMGDAARLQQIVWNLLSNAVKFTPRGGRVHTALRRAASSVEIVVTDSGAGIRADQLPHVFERFWQGDSSVTRRHGGLGIGLAIARHLVELHGGTITAQSEGEGRGATFTVRLPIAAVNVRTQLADLRGDGAAAEEGAAAAAVIADATVECPAELEGLSVLVVDDEPDARELLAAVLAHCHARVATAGSVDEALASFRDARPDALVCDVGMPARDGYDLIHALRALPREEGGDVPAVALTAYASAADRTRALAAGFDMHLAKPVTPQELVVVVASVVARRGRR